VEDEEKEKRRGERKRRRAEKRGEVFVPPGSGIGGGLDDGVKVKVEDDAYGPNRGEVDLASMMGFGGFGGAKKGRGG
jgi:hypothetical protein